jgi:hypothetical protein
MARDKRAKLYDAVGQIWLELYGGHVHVGKLLQGAAARQRFAKRTVDSGIT